MSAKADLTIMLLAEAGQHVSTIRDELSRLEALVATRDEQIQDLKDAVAERDDAIRELQEMNLRRTA